MRTTSLPDPGRNLILQTEVERWGWGWRRRFSRSVPSLRSPGPYLGWAGPGPASAAATKAAAGAPPGAGCSLRRAPRTGPAWLCPSLRPCPSSCCWQPRAEPLPPGGWVPGAVGVPGCWGARVLWYGRLRAHVWREGSARGSAGELWSEGGGKRGRRSPLPCGDPQGNSSFRPRGIACSCGLPTKSNSHRHGAGSWRWALQRAAKGMDAAGVYGETPSLMA